MTLRTGQGLHRCLPSVRDSAPLKGQPHACHRTLGSSVNRGYPPPVFFSDRLEPERGNGFFQRRLFGG
jgi:hypothetical protein